MKLDYNYTLLMLIFLRMTGCVFFNPILGRRNLPNLVKIGLTLMLSLFTYRLTPDRSLQIHSFLVLFVSGLKELLVGFMIGYIIQLFLSVIVMGGEMSDMQVGISMSKIYDPQSDVSMPLSASLLNAMYLLMFFATNAHLTLIQVFVRLGAVVPYGDGLQLKASLFGGLAALLGQMLVYAVKLSLPMVAVQLLGEIGTGLMMRAVPQIDVFTVQIQLKILIGFLVMLILVPPYASFLERLTTLMFDRISGLYAALA
ncbi:type III secretion protein [Caproiciproducens sp. NJN-50]|uniref:flagellar biosynthetic protein FliR n=1 Tax=Acutalibacteraceae TaxID=3082771 RepID=UPI000FFE2B76|nr:MULTISPECIES: flagellar biosynthetic protein FliR [Acutalibacteraceae]QAT50677.1 type III secretion protein [Caproiciproducens sp. NJN-50]